MQNLDILSKTSDAENGTAIASLVFSRGKIPVPRCDYCGALVPFNQPRRCTDEIASCIVCGYRNR